MRIATLTPVERADAKVQQRLLDQARNKGKKAKNSGKVYLRHLEAARKEGTIAIAKGSLGWKYPEPKSKAKATSKRKGKRKEVVPKIQEPQGPNLFTLCSMVEQGKLGVEVLLPHCVGGITIEEIQNWYVNEGLAKDLAEMRQANGG